MFFSLYNDIPQKEGAECLQKKLNMREDQQVPLELHIPIFKICNRYEIFQFNGDHYQQEIGSGMGSQPTQQNAKIFTGTEIDP